MGFWQEFMKGDSDQVHTPYAAMAIAFLLATPIIALSSAAVIYHVFIKDKGVDPPTVNLLLGMLGAATGGIVAMGASAFSKTAMSCLTSVGAPGGPAPTPGKAAKAE
jgi:hypothetical protein